MSRKILLGVLAVFALILPFHRVQAQNFGAVTVSACGTPNNTPVIGALYSLTMNPLGLLCINAPSSGSNAAAFQTGTSNPGYGSVTDFVSSGGLTIHASPYGSTYGAPFPVFDQQVYNAAIAPLAAGTNSIGNLNPASNVGSTALETAHVIKASAGNLYSFEVSADSTLSGAAWWVMIFNATSAPADGAVTPAKCYSMSSGQTGYAGAFAAGGVAFSTGIVIAVSTTGCFTKTSSAHAQISGDYL